MLKRLAKPFYSQRKMTANPSLIDEQDITIPLLLVTHGHLGSALIEAMEETIGPQKLVKCFDIEAEDDLDEKKEELACIVKNHFNDKGLLILTDLFGGIPSNMAMNIVENSAKRKMMDLVSGVNLPMLVKIASLRDQDDMDVHILAKKAEDIGRKYINIASDLLEE
jgi:PTS system mannose-specific IIA component